jgi:hypothetical protein
MSRHCMFIQASLVVATRLTDNPNVTVGVIRQART